MNNLAGELYEGTICKKNLKEAQEWYNKSAKIGNKSAIENLKKKFGQLEKPEVSKISSLSSDQQILEEIYSCLDKFLNGVPSSRFKEECIAHMKIIDQLEAKGNTRAILIKGVCYEEGFVVKNLEKAKECFIRAYIDQKDPLALYEQATCLYMDEKYHDALEKCELAASRGNKFAMSWLGARYLNGTNGFDQDDHKALEYLRKGAEAGSAWGNQKFKTFLFIKIKRNE